MAVRACSEVDDFAVQVAMWDLEVGDVQKCCAKSLMNFEMSYLLFSAQIIR